MDQICQKCPNNERQALDLNLGAKNTEYGFGRLIDHIGARLVVVAEHGRPAIVALSVEEHERLNVVEAGAASRSFVGT